MDFSFKALILDMDGVLINSEPLWRRAMISGFAESGIHVTEDECRTTMGMRIDEVIAIWIQRRNSTADAAAIQSRIIELLIALINTEGEALPGVYEIIAICRKGNIKLGLATSSSHLLMNTVLEKLSLSQSFDAAVSAEFLNHAKPHPEVFLVCAEKLGVKAEDCLVVEDSLNGVIAGKAAKMKVIAVPDDWQTKLQQFAISDFRRESMMEVKELIAGMVSPRDGVICD